MTGYKIINKKQNEYVYNSFRLQTNIPINPGFDTR